MAINHLILACEVMYTSTPMVAVEPFLVVVAQGCMQKVCKGGGGGRTWGFLTELVLIVTFRASGYYSACCYGNTSSSIYFTCLSYTG